MRELHVSPVTEEKGFFRRSRLAQGAVEQEGGWVRWEVHRKSVGEPPRAGAQGRLWRGTLELSQHFGIVKQGLSRGDAASYCGG